jgi:hypothetical protein
MSAGQFDTKVLEPVMPFTHKVFLYFLVTVNCGEV